MTITWQQEEGVGEFRGWVGRDAKGNRWHSSADRERCTVVTPEGWTATAYTPEHALDNAHRYKTPAGPRASRDRHWSPVPPRYTSEGEGKEMMTETIRQMFPQGDANEWAQHAWEGFVGSQTVEEFLEVARQKGYATPEAAVAAYVADLDGRREVDVPPDLAEHLLAWIDAHSSPEGITAEIAEEVRLIRTSAMRNRARDLESRALQLVLSTPDPDIVTIPEIARECVRLGLGGDGPIHGPGEWIAWCPACGDAMSIREADVGASEADPPEWSSSAMAERHGCQSGNATLVLIGALRARGLLVETPVTGSVIVEGVEIEPDRWEGLTMEYDPGRAAEESLNVIIEGLGLPLS